MVAALTYAAREIGLWCEAHPAAFPPVVIHITDGESGDGDPEPVADIMRQLFTSDGNVLLFNLHISSAGGSKVIFPDSDGTISTPDARRLFRLSSFLPELMVLAARGKGYSATDLARGYGYNADFVDLVSFFDIGTRPANLAR